MRLLKILYVATGFAVLVWILAKTDLGEVVTLARRVGFAGMALVLLLYLLAFVIDTITWQMTLPSVRLDARWLYRLFKIRMVGEAFNNATPAAGMGGEPVKAVLLKRSHGIGYLEGTTSLVLARTINTLALLIFLAGGYLLVLASDAVPSSLQVLAGVGLSATALGVLSFWAIQRFQMTSLAGTWLARFRFARALESALGHVRAIDDALVHFYTQQRGRLGAATLLAFVNWLLGAVEVWFVLRFLGHPLGLGDAWIMESMAQLVRLGAFFIPASLGAQEGAFFLAGSTLAGSGTLGVAVGVVRRFREILWIVWGFALGYGLDRAREPEPAAVPDGRE